MTINFKLDERFYLTIVFKMSGLTQPTLTATASVIGEEESVTLTCVTQFEHPEECIIYWIGPANAQSNIAYNCQATLRGSDLLARTWPLTEVNLRCFYTVKHQVYKVSSPHSNNVSISE